MLRGLLGKQTFEFREVVFRQGDASDWLYVNRSGQIKLTSCGPDGHEQIIRIGVAGHMLGFNTVDDRHHSYSAETPTPVRVCTIRHRPRDLRILNLKDLCAYAGAASNPRGRDARHWLRPGPTRARLIVCN